MNRLFVLFVFCASHVFSYTAKDVDALKKTVSSNLPSLEGWCSHEKAMSFIDLVLEVRPKVCVELGVFGGRSLYPVAAALKLLNQGLLIAVDPWDQLESIKYYDPEKDLDHIRWWSKLNMDFIYSSYCYLLKFHGLEEYVETLRQTSQEAAMAIDEEIDILHIDGNHSRAVSLFDVQNYLPKVRSGGYIWFTDALWESRAEAVDFISEECDFVRSIDKSNCILFRKR